MEHAGSLSPTTPEHQGVGTVWRQVAVKPYDFRLTKTQLAITFVVIRASSPFHVALSHRTPRITVIDKIDIL